VGRHEDPVVPDDVTGAELDRQVRGELGTLSRDNAVGVAQHLVMVGRLLEDDPEAAYAHAMAAQRRAGRVAVVREAAGLAAYRIGRYDEALRELRTARRLTGSHDHLPLMADCERGLGRPERALAMLASAEASALDRSGALELLIVAAGARLDLGQAEAAVVMLEVPELTAPPAPATAEAQARLMSAYADALEAAGRPDDSRTWLERAAAVDVEDVTGAAGRLGSDAEGADIVDLLEDEDEDGDDPDPDPHPDADADLARADVDAEVRTGASEGDGDGDGASSEDRE
jgi:tetratricopeptide (TPR) repeat protein